jgi:hypothetical protein
MHAKLLHHHAFPHALLALVLALLASNANAQSNLLVNGGAETGDTSGWFDPASQGFGVTNSASAVFAGNYSFHPGLFGPVGAWSHELRQDVDVSGLASMIDAGTVTSAFSCAGRTNQAGGASDPGHARVEFLSGGGALLDAYDTGVFTPFNTWGTYLDSRPVPAETRNVRVRLLGSRSVGSSTDCYFDDVILRLECGASTYCTAKTNSLGCVPSVSVSGVASLSGSSLVVGASGVLNNKSGILFWGRAAASAPFQGGTLCVMPPTLRTPVQLSGGTTGGADCTGAFSYDFTTHYLLTAGLAVNDDVYCQYWSRDPASPSTTNLTDAARFRICP